jgi:histidine triad (HIT) family protein
VLSFMDIFPQSKGHTLVIPKEAARNLLEMSDDGAAEAIKRVKKVAKAVETALKPDGVTIAQFNGAPAGQTVLSHPFSHHSPLGRPGHRRPWPAPDRRIWMS